MLDFEVLVTILALAPTAGLGLLTWSYHRLRNALGAVEGRLDDLSERVRRLESKNDSPAAVAVDPPPRAALRVDRAAFEPAVGPTLIAVPDLAAAAVPAVSRDASTELGRRFATVWERAARGLSAEAISRETGQPVGEVELILGLRRQAAAVGSATHPTSPDHGDRAEP